MSSAKYKVDIDDKAKKELKLLQRSNKYMASRILGALERLSLNPLIGKPLKADLKGYFSLRVGSYRILYQIWLDKQIVFVEKVSTRGEAYK